MKRVLRPILVVIAVVAAAFGYVQLAENKGYPLKMGTQAPPLRLPALAGGEVDLGALRGRLVVLNFWATWCPPCVEEMPSLERLHRALSDEGLSVVAVSVDTDEAVLRRFVEKHSLTFPILRDPGGSAAGTFRTTGYPETFEVDAQGVVRAHYVGPPRGGWDAPEMIEHFRRQLSPIPAR